MKYTVVTAPTQEPVTLAEFKAHARIDESESDGLSAGYLLAAREWVEDVCGRALLAQTIDAYYDRFGCLELPRHGAQSVTSVTYLDSSGSAQTLPTDYYYLNNRDRVNRVELVDGYSWPQTYLRSNAVTVRYVAGASALGDVPEALRMAILLLAGHWYNVRETVNIGNIVTEIPFTVSALVAPHRVFY